MEEKSCFFIGHHDAPDDLYPSIEYLIHTHYLRFGVRNFYVGRHGNFDAMVLRALKDLKERRRYIRRIIVTPYHPATHPIERSRDFDSIYYPFEKSVPPRCAISRANQKMIDTCDYLIAYAPYVGKSREFLEYAQHRQKRGLIHVSTVKPLLKLPQRDGRSICDLLQLSELLARAYIDTDPPPADRTSCLIAASGECSETALLSLCNQVFGDDLPWAFERAEAHLYEPDDDLLGDWDFTPDDLAHQRRFEAEFAELKAFFTP